MSSRAGSDIPVKVIAVDLDDTLNDFSETLRTHEFQFSDSYGLTSEKFDSYLGLVKSGQSEKNLLSTEYSYFRYRVHEQCYGSARARSDGVVFMQWLRANGWKIVICTYRDLRRAEHCTRTWLRENEIPFDHLFMANNKIVFCKLWGIPHLIDDDEFNIMHGARYDIGVYYPILERHGAVSGTGARGFSSFDEVRQWIHA